MEDRTRKVAERATCHAVQEAIVAYVSVRDRAPETAADLADFVGGDITAYRIVGGRAVGPGC